MLNFDAYIFDCDGVILDSNKIKGDTFKEVLGDFPKEYINQFLNFHYENGGMSRFLKFKYFFENLYKVNDVQKHVSHFSSEFSMKVKKKLIESSLVPGIENFLKLLNDKNKPCYINSGSEQEELKDVLLKKNLSKYFKLILGSPNSKIKNNEIIFNDLKGSKNAVFFGDSKNDFIAAENSSLKFVFVSEFSDWNNPDKTFYRTINNFLEIY